MQTVSTRSSKNRRHDRFVSLSVFLLAIWISPAEAATPIERENQRPGNPDWVLTHPAMYREIEGYASLTSVNHGEPLTLYVHTAEPSFRIDIYRMGWYGGTGARLVRGGIELPGQVQPMPTLDPESGLIECQWNPSYVLRTSGGKDRDDWLSGVYLAKVTASASGTQAYIIFVLREDDRRSDYLFQTSVTTYQAYNNWGGKSLYDFNSIGGAARKVSFNRPYAMNPHPLAARGNGAGDFLTSNSIPSNYNASPAGWEYNMVRWMEREGYDVTYSTNIDTHARPGLLLAHKAWLSVGHDEYWSWEMRTHVEWARRHHIGLGFFSANTCYWQIRLEPSTAGEPWRTIVAYKDKAIKEDPYALDGDRQNDRLVTTQWRETPVRLPEERLLGVMYETNPVDADIVIINTDHWALSGTGVREQAHLKGLLGYEVDRRFGQGPLGLELIARSPYQAGTTRHYADMISYTMADGTTVFAAGTIQWSWGLDDYNAPQLRSSRLNPLAQQITRNVLARLTGDRFPIAQAAGPEIGSVGGRLSFTGAGSHDPDGSIAAYRWEFGDGQTAHGFTTQHVYRRAGRYAVSLTVLDDRGAATRVTTTIDVAE